jgi:V8-like Glu-specific endopeptidase
MLRIFLLSLALCLPHHAAAKDKSPHQALKAPEQAQPWHAVGRLDLGNGFCTGTLISPKLVLTAAHCLYDDRAKKMRDPETIVFRAGYRHGRAIETRKARRYRAYDDYDNHARNTYQTMANDVAIVELERPIRHATVIPFQRMRKPALHLPVVVVSYGRGRSEIPAMEDGCKIMKDRGIVLQFTCDVTFGSSGSPVFVMTTSGPRIVSVMSSIGEIDGKKVSFGVTLGPRYEQIANALTVSNPKPKFAGVPIKKARQSTGFKRIKTSRLPQIKP